MDEANFNLMGDNFEPQITIEEEEQEIGNEPYQMEMKTVNGGRVLFWDG